MLEDMKVKFLENPKLIVEYLEKFEYANIKVHETYISFGRDITSSPKSIVIRLKNNDALLVHDYARNQIRDIFSFVILQRHVDFKDVINAAKDVLGIDDYTYINKQSGFRSFYGALRVKKENRCRILDESVLDKYSHDANLRFLRDGISILAQKFYKVCFDVESQAIVFPIRNETGEIIGLKARINRTPREDEQKYYYIEPCQMSSTLYNYFESYQYLESVESVYIVESEKSCMQAFTFGVRNIVALGSSSLSRKQASMLLALNAKNYIFLMDEGLNYETVERNMGLLKVCGIMKVFNIYYWEDSDYSNKISPTDLGEIEFKKIINEKLIPYKGDG